MESYASPEEFSNNIVGMAHDFKVRGSNSSERRLIRSILLIDDDTNFLLVAEVSLESEFDVFCADSGTAGIIIAELEQPDVILLDVKMPQLDGPSTLAMLRENPLTKHIPVIFMSASVQSHQSADYKKFDVEGLIQKPFDSMQLAKMVRELTSL